MPSMFSMDPFEMLRMSPFSLMRRFTEEMDQYFAQLGMGRGGQSTAAGSGLFSPPVEVVERDGTLTVRVDLPGMTKDDVRVEITENILTIEGERRAEHEEKQDGMVQSERRYGMFRRQIALPEGVNAEQATASFKDGVLEVTMPAPQRQAHGRQIEIQSGASSTTESQAASGKEQEHAQSTTAVGSS
jgi:HSP20 family protein